MHRLIIITLSFLFVTSISAQVFVKSEPISTYSRIDLLGFGLPASNGVALHKVWYNTTGADGQADIASGLVVVPTINSPLPQLCQQHGTQSPRNNVPSTGAGILLELWLGSSGYLVSAADYIGMGESRGFHPYLHAATQASAAIDLLRATREFSEQEGIALNGQLFVTGYSQGGHAAMAALKSLEEDFADEFQVTAAAPMSGPYNLSKTLIEGILTDEEYLFPGFALYTVKGFQEVYGNIYEELTDIFKPRYAAIMSKFDNTAAFTLDQLHQELVDSLVAENGVSVQRFMFQEDIIAALESGDQNLPIFQALVDNDLHNWVPQTPTRLYYCESDEVVSAENTTFTDSLMRANGAADVMAINISSALGHVACATPAYFATITYFNSFELTNTSEISSSQAALSIFPNPVSDILQWNFDGTVESIKIFNELGKVIWNGTIRESYLNIENLASGLYFVQMNTNEGLLTKKFIKE